MLQYFGGLYVEGPKLTAVTVQMPAVEFCQQEASPNPCWYVPIVSVMVSQAGVGAVASSEMVAIASNPHVLNSCDSSVAPFLPDALKIGQLMAECDPIIAHADGTVVTGRNPAQLGETISIYATGLGWGITSALIGTPTPNEGIPGDVSAVRAGFDFNPAIDPAPSDIPTQTDSVYVGLTGRLVGIYQINVTLPAENPTSARTCGGFGDTNVGINLRFTGFNSVIPVRLCVKF